MTAVGVPAAALPAWLRLSGALDAAGASVPCIGRDGALWTSEDVEDREAAAHRCAPCPAIEPCGTYATTAKEKYGTWAGVDRTVKPSTRKATA